MLWIIFVEKEDKKRVCQRVRIEGERGGRVKRRGEKRERGIKEARTRQAKVFPTLMVLSEEALNSMSPATHNAQTGP